LAVRAVNQGAEYPEISLEVTHRPDEATAGHVYLTATVTITNRGTQNLEMIFDESTVTIARAASGKDAGLGLRPYGDLRLIDSLITPSCGPTC
jgi:hypothetical protein